MEYLYDLILNSEEIWGLYFMMLLVLMVMGKLQVGKTSVRRRKNILFLPLSSLIELHYANILNIKLNSGGEMQF